jgi:Skp family chaperone for outer membrane proteins
MRLGLALLAMVWLPLAVVAQEPVQPAPPPVLVVNQTVLFEQSAFGRSAQMRLEAASRALAAENREIEAALETEERTLTEQRATLPSSEFRALAEAFNLKVEGIRKAQDSKSRSITLARDEDRKRFFAAAMPVLDGILRERGAVVMLEWSQVVLSLDPIDITAEAIRRLDAEIGTGDLSPASSQPETPEP